MAYASLHDRLRGPIATALKKDLKIENLLALPRIEKVVVSTGINKTKMDSKEMHEYIAESLTMITSQKPVFTKARKAISNFKTREGMVVGAMVTLRGRQMEEFLDRLLSYALPRVRDFRGVTAKLDGHGNYSIGIQDHSIFPEVPPPDAKQIFGLQVQITTTTDSDDEAHALLKEMGMPFKKEQAEEPVKTPPPPLPEELKEEKPSSAKATEGRKEETKKKDTKKEEPVEKSEAETPKKESESVDSPSESDDTSKS